MWTAVIDQIMISCIERVFQKQDAACLTWLVIAFLIVFSFFLVLILTSIFSSPKIRLD